MRRARAKKLVVLTAFLTAVVASTVLAIEAWPRRRSIYLKLFYEPYPRFVEVARLESGGVDRKRGKLRSDYYRKRIRWVPGPEEAIESYLCGACLVGNHGDCRPEFILMSRDDWTDGTQHFFHCLCSDPTDRPH